MSDTLIQKKYRLGISGFGFVGSAVYNSLKDKDSIKIYDPKFQDYNRKDDLLLCDIIFICVSTPVVNGKFNNEYVKDNLDFLAKKEYRGLVVIKSTIHPDYLNEYDLYMVSNPEFLNENTANEDFKNQKIILIGGRIDHCEILKNVYLNQFNLSNNSIIFEYVSFKEALIFKYIRNIKIAYDVMFWEFVQETTGNYRKFNKILDKIDYKITNICTDGSRGFGGHCLPKDIISYPNTLLTKYLLDYNTKIRNE